MDQSLDFHIDGHNNQPENLANQRHGVSPESGGMHPETLLTDGSDGTLIDLSSGMTVSESPAMTQLEQSMNVSIAGIITLVEESLDPINKPHSQPELSANEK